MSDWRFIVNGSTIDPETQYNFKPQQWPGAGMAPISNISTDFGLLDGALFQRQRAEVRTFTMVGTLSGSSVAALHANRKNLIDAVKPDRGSDQDPVVIQYVGAGSTIQGSAFYDAGLELGNVDVYNEVGLGMRFMMFDPYFEKTTSTTCDLTTREMISVCRIIQRDADGQWSNMDGGFSNGNVETFARNSSGSLYAGGDFVNGGSISLYRVGVWNGSQWSALGDGACALVEALVVDFSDTLYATGTFVEIGGTTASRIAQWNGAAWSAVGTGSGLRFVSVSTGFDLAVDQSNNLWVVGIFDEVDGVAACGVAKWDGSNWTSPCSGLQETGNLLSINSITIDKSNNVYVCGAFGAMGTTTVAGSSVAKWDGTDWDALGDEDGGTYRVVHLDNAGLLYLGGQYDSVGSSGSDLQVWNGTGWNNVGVSIKASGGPAPDIRSMASSSADNTLHIGGTAFTSGAVAASFNGVEPPGNYIQLNNNTFILAGIEFPANSNINAIDVYGDTLTFGFDQAGTASAAAVTTINNNGTAQAFPIISASGPGKLFQIINHTTGEALYFNITLQSGEVVTLDLRQGKKTFTSSARGNIIYGILPGSDMTTWKLLPGSNKVSFYIDDDSASATIQFTERFWSIDGGA